MSTLRRALGDSWRPVVRAQLGHARAPGPRLGLGAVSHVILVYEETVCRFGRPERICKTHASDMTNEAARHQIARQQCRNALRSASSITRATADGARAGGNLVAKNAP
jgi:hypothetical protein